MISIDINCDMGEGFDNDALLMPFISSANIACGFHAGDVDTMRRTVQLARQHQVAIGAHPGFNDKANFGRVEINLPAEEIHELITTQLQLMQRVCDTEHAQLHHVKPHGALYNMAAKNPAIARAIVYAIKHFNSELILYGLSGSHLIIEGEMAGLKTASEVFADRTYHDDGSLTPRSSAGALINDLSTAEHQVIQMIKQQKVTSINNKIIPILAETICIHGDGKHAVEFVKSLNQLFIKNGIILQSPTFQHKKKQAH